MRRHWGRIISLWARFAYTGGGWVRWRSKKPYRIMVNVVNPKNIDERELTMDEARRDRLWAIACKTAAVKFFASIMADYITGHTDRRIAE